MKIEAKRTELYFYVLLVILYSSVSFGSSISYREDSNTTPKKYVDKFKLNKEYKTIPPNETQNGIPLQNHSPQPRSTKPMNKVKAVLPGEMTMRRMSDEDDDDDDDGGEYGGVAISDVKGDRSDKDHPKLSQGLSLMAVREVNVVAVEIPGGGCGQTQKESASATSSEWSEWSPCSQPCGPGVQSRSRYRPFGQRQDKEQQYRPCHLADCV